MIVSGNQIFRLIKVLGNLKLFNIGSSSNLGIAVSQSLGISNAENSKVQRRTFVHYSSTIRTFAPIAFIMIKKLSGSRR